MRRPASEGRTDGSCAIGHEQDVMFGDDRKIDAKVFFVGDVETVAIERLAPGGGRTEVSWDRDCSSWMEAPIVEPVDECLTVVGHNHVIHHRFDDNEPLGDVTQTFDRYIRIVAVMKGRDREGGIDFGRTVFPLLMKGQASDFWYAIIRYVEQSEVVACLCQQLAHLTITAGEVQDLGSKNVGSNLSHDDARPISQAFMDDVLMDGE